MSIGISAMHFNCKNSSLFSMSHDSPFWVSLIQVLWHLKRSQSHFQQQWRGFQNYGHWSLLQESWHINQWVVFVVILFMAQWLNSAPLIQPMNPNSGRPVHSVPNGQSGSSLLSVQNGVFSLNIDPTSLMVNFLVDFKLAAFNLNSLYRWKGQRVGRHHTTTVPLHCRGPFP